MTDKVNSLTVILEENIDTEVAEHLINAIRCFAGVIFVKANIQEGLDDVIAKARIKHELYRKICDLFLGELK